MIELRTGDIFDEDVEALVNSVNCVGVMGRGIALQFKNLFPENFKAYAEACERQEVQPGWMFVYESGTRATLSTSLPSAIQEPHGRHSRGD